MSQDKTIFIIVVTFLQLQNIVGTARKNENSAADVRANWDIPPTMLGHFEKLREPLQTLV
jgi:hypothetical protein